MSIKARPLSFADQVCQNNKKPTKLKKMLDEMEKVIPWGKIMAMIEPHYHRTGGRGRQPYPLEAILRGESRRLTTRARVNGIVPPGYSLPNARSAGSGSAPRA